MSDLRLGVDFGTAYSKAVIARPGKLGGVDPESVRPLAIGEALHQPTPLLAPCAVFVGDERLYFGLQARLQAERLIATRQIALTSFKTVLSDQRLAQSCEFRMPRDIDPTGAYRRGDLITLFLAWLLSGVDRAAGPTEALPPIRVTTPYWHSNPGSPALSKFVALFSCARLVANELGDELRSDQGLPHARTKDALQRALDQPAVSAVEAIVLEAVAAAACHSETEAGITHLLVVDMGAGTTDFAGLHFRGQTASEIVEARKTIMSAGDEIDFLVQDLIIANARAIRAPEAQTRLRKQTALNIRETKAALFEIGKTTFTFDGKSIGAKLGDLKKPRAFKAFEKRIATAFSEALDATAAAAQADGRQLVHVMLAGGGANLPILERIVRAGRPAHGGVKAQLLPLAPEWVRSKMFDEKFAAAFPQLAVAIGAAVAPAHLLFNQQTSISGLGVEN